METLNDYFKYEKDYNNINKIYYNLSLSMKEIHNNGLVIPKVSSDKILYDNGFKYEEEIESLDFESGKRANLLSLAKLILGTYLSLSTEFKDFSSVDNEWISNNLKYICDAIKSENFPKEYFEDVFLEGKNEYFSDYLNILKQNEQLGGKGNSNTFKKVLSNSASSFYSYDNYNNDEVELDKPKAKVNMLLYPLLIAGTLLIIVGIMMLIK